MSRKNWSLGCRPSPPNFQGAARLEEQLHREWANRWRQWTASYPTDREPITTETERNV